MSLEATLAQTNELLSQLLVVLRTASESPAELGAPTTTAVTEKATRSRKTKTDTTEAQAPAAAPAEAPAVQSTNNHPDVVIDEGRPLGRVKTDPEGTRYFVIEKHRTVYAQKPGDADCTISGAEIVPAWVYLAKKAEFNPGNAQAAAAPTTAPAPAPAQTTQDASGASSSTASGSPAAEVPFSLLTEKAVALGKSTEPGQGREALLAILKKWLPGNDKPTITALAPLGKNAEILADVMAVLEPKAAAQNDGFDLLG